MENYGPNSITAPAGAIILHVGDNISAKVNSAPAGATFFFEPGIYRGVSIVPKNGQTFIGAEGAVLNGSEVLTNWTKAGNLWAVGGQTQEGFRAGTQWAEPGSMRAGYPETVFVDDKPLKPVDALSKVVPGTFYFDYAADKIYLADNPTGHKIEAGKLDFAFRGNEYAGNVQNVIVKNLIIEKYDSPVQQGAIQAGPGWTVQDNEVRLNYGIGISARTDGKVLGNLVHDNGQGGLNGQGNKILVEGNEVAKNGFWSGIDTGHDGGGIKFGSTDGLTVRSNYAHDNHGTGMWTDWNNIHTLYENNVVIGNSNEGIQHEISYDAIIRNNVLMRNGIDVFKQYGWMWGTNILVQNSSNVEVYGNKIDMTGSNGITLVQSNRGSGAYGPFVTTGNDIHDNTIVSHDNVGRVGGAADFNAAGFLNGGNTWEDNHYFMTDTGNRFWWQSGQNFSNFKAASGESGTVSQAYPNTDNWLNLPVDTNPPPVDTNPPPVDTDPPPDDTNPPPVDTSPPPSDDDTTSPPPVDTNPPPTDNPTEHLVLRGGRGHNTLVGGSGDDQLFGGYGNDGLTGGPGHDGLFGGPGRDTLIGASGNDELFGGRGRDIFFSGPGKDVINGGRDQDVLLLDGTMKDYAIEVAKRTIRITDDAGETDTVKGVELFRFLGDGASYAVKKQDLVQIKHTESLEKFLDKAGIWNAIDSASNNATDSDHVLATLRQQVHDAFGPNEGDSSNTVNELAEWLHFTHHE